MTGRLRLFDRPRDIGDRFHADDDRQAAILPTSGVASNGKPILDWDEAAAQLTRTGNTWSPVLGGPITVTYAFRASAPSNMPSGVSGFQQFNASQIIAAEAALQLWADAANIVFVRVGSGVSGPGAYSNNASILFANYTTETDSASAFAYLPSPGATGSVNFAGDIWVDISEPENSIPVFGDFGPHVLAHEIGHAIGLNHPGDYDGGSPTYAADAVYWQDARMFTVMSYFGSANAGGNLPSFSWGPQYHDIAAVQRLYGANMSTRTGDTTYGFNSNSGRTLFEISSATQGVTFSIWDAGGVDTLDLSGYFEDADIDLRPGAFSSAGPTATQGPAKYNLSIAQGVVIENAVGGHGDDTLTGNDAANDLRGGPGGDVLSGNLGDDILVGGAGADTLNGGSGRDIASYSTSNAAVGVSFIAPSANTGDAFGDVVNIDIEAIEGSSFDDTLEGDGRNNEFHGGGGADILRGDSGNDTLIGGSGGDDISGGAGADLASYASAAGAIEIVLSNISLNSGDAAGDTIRADVEMIEGSQFGDLLQGNAGDNFFLGVGGDDTLLGGFGNDTLIGGVGGDSLNGGDGFDVASYSTSASSVRVALWNPASNTGEAAGDTINFMIEVIEGSTFSDNLQGNSSANNLRGGGGDDLILGGFGNDTLVGGAGADDMGGGPGFDVVSYAGGGAVRIALWNPAFNTGDAAGDNIRADVEVVEGGAFGDTMEGSAAANNLHGAGGADLLFGGGGADTLWGQAGDDTLSGGSGPDLIYYDAGGGADVVTDFAGGAGVSDLIQLAGLGAQFDTFAEIVAAATQAGANLVIDFGGGQSLTLLNATIAALDADDFIFT